VRSAIIMGIGSCVPDRHLERAPETSPLTSPHAVPHVLVSE
jgi:hypothetical protein